jgi:hypothetical protein
LEINNAEQSPSLNTLSVHNLRLSKESNDSYPTVTPPASIPGSTIRSVIRSVSDYSSSHSVGVSAMQPLPVTNVLAMNEQPVCIGDGLDASSEGIIATVVVSGALGLVLWVRCESLLFHLLIVFAI